eukprot:gene16272-22452_t
MKYKWEKPTVSVSTFFEVKVNPGLLGGDEEESAYSDDFSDDAPEASLPASAAATPTASPSKGEPVPSPDADSPVESTISIEDDFQHSAEVEVSGVGLGTGSPSPDTATQLVGGSPAKAGQAAGTSTSRSGALSGAPQTVGNPSLTVDQGPGPDQSLGPVADQSQAADRAAAGALGVVRPLATSFGDRAETIMDASDLFFDDGADEGGASPTAASQSAKEGELGALSTSASEISYTKDFSQLSPEIGEEQEASLTDEPGEASYTKDFSQVSSEIAGLQQSALREDTGDISYTKDFSETSAELIAAAPAPTTAPPVLSTSAELPSQSGTAPKSAEGGALDKSEATEPTPQGPTSHPIDEDDDDEVTEEVEDEDFPEVGSDEEEDEEDLPNPFSNTAAAVPPAHHGPPEESPSHTDPAVAQAGAAPHTDTQSGLVGEDLDAYGLGDTASGPRLGSVSYSADLQASGSSLQADKPIVDPSEDLGESIMDASDLMLPEAAEETLMAALGAALPPGQGVHPVSDVKLASEALPSGGAALSPAGGLSYTADFSQDMSPPPSTFSDDAPEASLPASAAATPTASPSKPEPPPSPDADSPPASTISIEDDFEHSAGPSPDPSPGQSPAGAVSYTADFSQDMASVATAEPGPQQSPLSSPQRSLEELLSEDGIDGMDPEEGEQLIPGALLPSTAADPSAYQPLDRAPGPVAATAAPAAERADDDEGAQARSASSSPPRALDAVTESSPPPSVPPSPPVSPPSASPSPEPGSSGDASLEAPSIDSGAVGYSLAFDDEDDAEAEDLQTLSPLAELSAEKEDLLVSQIEELMEEEELGAIQLALGSDSDTEEKGSARAAATPASQSAPTAAAPQEVENTHRAPSPPLLLSQLRTVATVGAAAAATPVSQSAPTAAAPQEVENTQRAPSPPLLLSQLRTVAIVGAAAAATPVSQSAPTAAAPQEVETTQRAPSPPPVSAQLRTVAVVGAAAAATPASQSAPTAAVPQEVETTQRAPSPPQVEDDIISEDLPEEEYPNAESTAHSDMSTMSEVSTIVEDEIPEPSGDVREVMVEEITDSTMQALLHESIQVMVDVVGQDRLFPGPSVLPPSSPSPLPQAPPLEIIGNLCEPAVAVISSPVRDSLELDQDPYSSELAVADISSPARGSLELDRDPYSNTFEDLDDLEEQAGGQAGAPAQVEEDDRGQDLGYSYDDDFENSSLDPDEDEAEQTNSFEEVEEDLPPPPPSQVTTKPEDIELYVSKVMDIFAQVLYPGQEPLGLDGFLSLERAIPDASDAQHIHNKLLYDSVNEALISVYRSCGRIKDQGELLYHSVNEALISVYRSCGRIKVRLLYHSVNEALISVYRSCGRIKVPACVGRSLAPVVRALPTSERMGEEVRSKVLGWAKVCIKQDIQLERLLALDAAEDEHTAENMDEEIADVKMEVADMLWDDLLTDAAQALQEIDEKLSRRQ